MKAIYRLFLLILLSLCLCNRKDQKLTQNKTTVILPGQSSVKEEMPASDTPEESVTSSSEDTTYPDNIINKLNERINSDSTLIVQTSDVYNDLGMNGWTYKPLPFDTVENSQGGFRHYNPDFLKKIDASLDLPIIRQLLSGLKTVDMSDVWEHEDFTMEIKLFETDKFNSILLHRMFLKLYPKELKKYRKRYERFLQSDTIGTFPQYILGVPSDYRGDIMAFWVRRSFDSTDTYIESILQKATSIIYPERYRIIDSTFNEMKKVHSDEQIVLTHDSYDDAYSLDPQASLFPGRDNMLHHYADLLDSLLDYGSLRESEYRLTIDKTWEMLKEHSRSAPFTGNYTFYGLLPKAGSLVWRPVTPIASVTFKSYPPSCGDEGDDNWALHLTIGIQGDTTKPVLLTAIDANSRKKPDNESYLLQGTFDNKELPESDTASYLLTTNYVLPQNMKQIANLWKVDTFCFVWGEVYRRVNLKSSLIAKWSNGTVDTIYNENGYGHYSFVDAEITDIILTDIDGDGTLEIYFTSGASGRWIGYLNKNNTIRLQKIKEACNVAVGGC